MTVQRVGKYELKSVIGRGGMGVVYKAYDPLLQRYVALKLMGGSMGADELQRMRFMREARSAAQLQHPNIVGVHDLGCVDGTYYVRLDYVDGADLASLLARGLPGTPLALHIADELALALGAVHGLTDDEGRPLGTSWMTDW